MSPLAFRNVDASPSDPVATWPYEAIVTCIERGLVADWQPLIAEIRARPWADVARLVQAYVECEPDDHAAATFFGLVIERARSDAEAREREEVAARVRQAVVRSGLSQSAFARAVGTSASRLSTYAAARVVPSAAMLVRIEAVGRADPR